MDEYQDISRIQEAIIRRLHGENSSLFMVGDSGKVPADFPDAGEIAPWASDAVTAFVKAGVLNGSDEGLLPAGVRTRAQMAQILYNLMQN